MIKNPLNRLYNGELLFEAFTIQTRQYWLKLASRLLCKWTVPPSVSVDDIVQEMLFKCWDLLDTYDPDKGSLERYIVFNTIEYAKRYLHKQRGAKGHSGKAVSRYPILVEDIEAQSRDLLRVDPDQELAISRLEKISLASNLKERLILNRLARIPSIDLVTQDLYSDPDIKLYLQLNSLSDTRNLVYRSTLKLSRRSKTIG